MCLEEGGIIGDVILELRKRVIKLVDGVIIIRFMIFFMAAVIAHFSLNQLISMKVNIK